MSRGFSLLETLIALAIVSLAALAAASGISAGARTGAAAADPLKSALQTYAASAVRDAMQSRKYGSPGALTSGTFQTALTIEPSASPLPATITATVSGQGGAAARVDITVTAAGETASAGATVYVQAPLPGSQIPRPGLVPAPVP